MIIVSYMRSRMIQRIPLSKCKLWWPAWQMGIPFNAYGFTREVMGNGYKFTVDPEMDSWLCENGDLMPISTATLEDCDEGPIKWTSFKILPNNTVQVNLKMPDVRHGYHVDLYPLEALSFVGEAYSLDE